ncbi:hypothetical protein EG68_00482 [Paragonimus skrjabini miyazakii]|uniref:Uncharacterized protein n=1 Tax=Paragonimus skrjabini miyazakii TaxID=59628 RepID=A0A8S9ZAF9_9TREM|nr:hypothetical protein EG68_00482 [Paragonimus skrjabini miyazakii]
MKNPPMQPYHAPQSDVLYMLDAKRFNLTALLKSGQYYLDETGLLVAPNGTRYRIPSGPPEGRKPLRPDRPDADGHVNMNEPDDVHSPVQQDSSKYANSKTQYGMLSLGTNYDQFNRTLFSYPTLQSHKLTPSPIPLLDSTTQAIEPSAQVDWNVILLAVILSSISLACNLGLIVLLSWKPCCLNLGIKPAGTSSKEKKITREHSKQERVFSESSVMCSCTVDYTPQEMNTSYHFVNTPQCSAAVWCEPTTECIPTNEFPLRQTQRLVDQQNHGQRLVRPRDSIHNRSVFNSRHPMTVNGKALTSTSRRAEKSDQGSSSGGSWKMVLSDGIISDTTCDGESTEDSGNNSDAPFRTRGGYWKQNIPKTDSCNRPKYYSNRKSTNITVKDALLTRKPPECLHRIRDSSHEQLTPIRSSCTTQSSCDEQSFQPAAISETNVTCSDLCANSIYVWHTLGIHIGLLGVVLSIIQLFTLCSALSCRMKLIPPETEPKATLLSEIVCVLSTSLAADTILCARQYLISALLIVYWSTLSLSVLCRLDETSKMSNALVSLCMSDKQTDFSSILGHTGKPSATPKRQQRYAHLALMHSLPWALAAGTALVITFAIYSNKGLGNQHTAKVNDYPKEPEVKLNFFFGGLETLLVCRLNRDQFTMNKRNFKNAYGVTQDPSYILPPTETEGNFNETWIPVFLLVLLPQLAHIGICLVYSILLRNATRKHAHSGMNGSICSSLGSVCFLIFIEFTSCAVPVIWTYLFLPSSFRHRSSVSYVNRVILLHLLVDPWLVACLLRLLSTHLNGSTVTVTTKPPIVALRDRSVSQYSEMAQSVSVDSSGANVSDPRFGLGLPIKQKQSALSASPVRLSCLPIARRMDSPVNMNQPSLTSAHVFMSCFPNSNLLVSPLAMPSMEAPTITETLSKPRLLVPITNTKLNVQTIDSISGSVGMPPFVTSSMGTKDGSGFTFRPNGNLNAIKYDATENLVSCSTHCQETTITDVYPKLCPHHQQLLEQHIQPTPLQIATKFGSVPRLFAQRSNNVVARPDIRLSELITSEGSSQAVTPSDLVNVSEEQQGKYTSYRQTVSQSTATAAVMAAAAAAVAAQTGTMNRSSIEMDGGVQLSTINSVHPLGGSYTHCGSQYSPKHATLALNTNQPTVKQ